MKPKLVISSVAVATLIASVMIARHLIYTQQTAHPFLSGALAPTSSEITTSAATAKDQEPPNPISPRSGGQSMTTSGPPITPQGFWSTFTNPEDAFSIGYPTDLGQPYIGYASFTRRTILDWKDQNFYLQIYFINTNGLPFHNWIGQNTTTGPGGAHLITINGLSGVAAAPTLVYLEAFGVYPSPMIYEIDLECNEGGGCNQWQPPAFWEQMLNTFETSSSTAF